MCEIKLAFVLQYLVRIAFAEFSGADAIVSFKCRGKMFRGGIAQFLPDKRNTVIRRVTSLWKMEELVKRLVRWGIHPEELITDEFPLEKVE